MDVGVGNMTAGVSNNLGYSAAYTYSGDGLRLRVQETGALYPDLWLQYDGVRPVVEGTLEGDTWTTTARNVWEGDTYYSPLVLRLLPSGGYNYLSDGLGSTRQLMRNSDHTITDTYAYDAFGNTLTSTGITDNPYRYVGALGYRAGGGGLLQLGVRWYTPPLGVFMQQDPLWLTASESGVSGYPYAGGSPAHAVDPSGNVAEWIIIGACICLFVVSVYGIAHYCIIGPGEHAADPLIEKVQKCRQFAARAQSSVERHHRRSYDKIREEWDANGCESIAARWHIEWPEFPD